MGKTHKRIIQNKRSFYYLLLLALLIFVPVLIYGTRQGFYWDDWSQLLLHEKFGDELFPEYFSYDRPFSWWTHAVAFRFCGNNPVLWHVYFGIIHFLCVYTTHLVFKRFFSQKEEMCELACILLAVCPIFTQYSISIAYSQHFTDYFLFISSFYSLILAVENDNIRKKVLFYILSFALTAAHLSITEYFSFLDLTKLYILYYEKNNQKKIFDEVIVMSSTAIIFIGFVLIRQSISVWDENFNANTSRILELLNKDFFRAVSETGKNMIYDFFWLFGKFPGSLFSIAWNKILTKTNLLIFLISGSFAYIFLFHANKYDSSLEKNREIKILLFSVFWILLGIAPFWMMNENCFTSEDPFHADRCFIAAQPGMCLLISYITFRMFTEKKRFAIASSFVIFLFSASYLKNEQNAIYEKEKQNSFYMQIAERIPAFNDFTAIYSETPVFPEQGNFATASALNIIYSDKKDNGMSLLPVWIFGTHNLETTEHKWFSVNKRNYEFESEKGIFIIPYHKFGNCAWIMTPEDVDAPHLTGDQKRLSLLSDVDMISTNEKHREVNKIIFGEKKESWCIYYQKASLLRQQKKWNEIAVLYDEVKANGYSPFDNRSNAPFEWVPFIIGLKNSGRDGDAIEVIDKCIHVDYAYKEWLSTMY